LEQVKRRPPAPPRTINDQIPPDLEDICLKAIAKQPGDRFKTAADLAAALRAAVAPAPVEIPAAPAGKGALVAAAVVLVGLGLAAAGVYRSGLLGGDGRPAAPAVPGTGSAAARLTPPSMFVHVLRRDDTSQVASILSSDATVLREGDLIGIEVLLDEPAYAYVFWCDAEGNLERLWPAPDAPLDGQQKVRTVTIPQASPGSSLPSALRPLEGVTGAEMVVACVNDKPLSAQELRSLEERKFVLEERLSAEGRFVEYYHPKAVDGRGQPRGLGKKLVESGKLRSKDFEPELARRFRAYHGMLFFTAP
jgi:hypothetical protein